MSIGIPSSLAPALFAKALSRLFFVYAATALVLSEILLFIAAGAKQSLGLFIAAACIGIPGLFLWRMILTPGSRLLGIGYVTSLSMVLFACSYGVLEPVDVAFTTGFTPLALMSFAVAMVCGNSVSIRGRLIWISVGYALSQIVLLTVVLLTGSYFSFDFRVITGVLVATIAIIVTPTLLSKTTRYQATIDDSSEAAREELFRAEATKDATMAVHDTLLATLSLIAMSEPGGLTDSVRRNVENRLANLHGTDWVAQSVVQTPSVESHWSAALLQVIATAEQSDLQVNLTGQPDAIDVLTEIQAEALLAAVTQCLSNVQRHSGQKKAEIVTLCTPDTVTVTISDAGSGFDAQAVPDDRLGLRLSVIDRIESVGGNVSVWSGAGMGTAVMLKIMRGGGA